MLRPVSINFLLLSNVVACWTFGSLMSLLNFSVEDFVDAASDVVDMARADFIPKVRAKTAHYKQKLSIAATAYHRRVSGAVSCLAERVGFPDINTDWLGNWLRRKSEMQILGKETHRRSSQSHDSRKGNNSFSLAKELLDIAELKRQGMLSESEFLAAKAKLLSTKETRDRE